MKPSRWMDVNTHTHTANTKIFEFIAALVFKLQSPKVLFISEKTINYCKIINGWNVKFSGYF